MRCFWSTAAGTAFSDGVTLTATGKAERSVLDDITDKMKVLFSPFTWVMWMVTIALMLLVSLTFWIIEHGMLNENDRFTADSVASLTVRAQYDIIHNEVRTVDAQNSALLVTPWCRERLSISE